MLEARVGLCGRASILVRIGRINGADIVAQGPARTGPNIRAARSSSSRPVPAQGGYGRACFKAACHRDAVARCYRCYLRTA